MRITERRILARNICMFKVEAPLIAQKAQPGQFVIVRHKVNGERIPLTIADYDRQEGTITIVVQGVGKSTKEINQLQAGDSFLDVLGPLGKAYPVKRLGTVICVAGGLGVAPLYPKAKALHEAGNKIISMIGAQTKDLLIMVDEMEQISDEMYFSTDDGSFGHHGFITEVLQGFLSKNHVDEVVAIGPAPMMASVAKVTEPFGVSTQVSLNTLMIDGTGMCGGCRVTVGGEVRFCCVDGPTFDGHQVDWQELMSRQRFYREQEQEALHRCRLEEVQV